MKLFKLGNDFRLIMFTVFIPLDVYAYESLKSKRCCKKRCQCDTVLIRSDNTLERNPTLLAILTPNLIPFEVLWPLTRTANGNNTAASSVTDPAISGTSCTKQRRKLANHETGNITR